LKTLAAFTFLAFCMLAPTVDAQDSDYARSYALPGISAEVTAYTGAPSGFDPTTASDEDLQSYGYPRRPDPNDTKAYAMWAKAVATERITPELGSNLGTFHLPNQRIATLSTIKNTTNVVSGNWSGYSLVGGSPKLDEAVGAWIVPNINTQFEKLTGYTSMWVGIDGNCSCNDLIQDGTSQYWLNGSVVYFAWIEFFPENEVPVKNFPVQPGDVIYAYSAAVSKSGKLYGYFYLANLTTRRSVSASLVAPKGITFSGKSAEWIVERPEINGSFENPLPNYGYAYMDDAWAYREGSNAAITYHEEANENFTMGLKGKLSKAYEQDSDSFWFEWLAY
jgi:hypothetical protein